MGSDPPSNSEPPQSCAECGCPELEPATAPPELQFDEGYGEVPDDTRLCTRRKVGEQDGRAHGPGPCVHRNAKLTSTATPNRR